MSAQDELSYEAALEQFDLRLRALEDGRLTLEEALTAVEEGRRYLKLCESKLEAARQKIEVRPAEEAGPAAGDAHPLAIDAGEDDLLGQLPPVEDRLL